MVLQEFFFLFDFPRTLGFFPLPIAAHALFGIGATWSSNVALARVSAPATLTHRGAGYTISKLIADGIVNLDRALRSAKTPVI
jgi:hypothetical protein